MNSKGLPTIEHRKYREVKLELYRMAIEHGIILNGYSSFSHMVCHYDQLVWIDQEISKLENSKELGE
jgi:hypothetical protein